MKPVIAVVFAASFLFSSIASADLVFSAPPRERPGEGLKTYGSLVTRLSEVLGEKVVYQQPANWMEYSNKLRNNEYDIIFDGPHFIAWRIEHLHNRAVARLPGHLTFYVVTKKGNRRLSDLQSIRGSTVCAMASPNLTSAMLLNHFKYDVAVPDIVAVKGGMEDIIKSLQGNKCNAAVVRAEFYDRVMTDEQRSGYRVLYKSQQFPNQGISVSDRLTKGQIKKISSVLLQGDPGLKPITQRFEKSANKFVASDNAEYAGISALLDGVVWGW